ncbi:unnamed protein product [Paramecium pentaurelia]|uniref:DUF541 domain-containing protein n=1 Tax=Paramecium pentaurelia TaxID=43138 RepID=A0A8S1T191_9CILI|nr:unnamed protein product [Paramecium pentaurelia]
MLILFITLLSIYGKRINKEEKKIEEHVIMNNDDHKGFTTKIPGAGTIDLVPSIGTVSFAIEVMDKDASAALEQANKLVTKAVQSIKYDLLYSNYEIQTGIFQLQIRYDYTTSQQKLIGYTVTNQLYVTTKDMQLIGKIITVGVNAGLNRIDGVTYSNNALEIQKANNEALKLAIEDAKRKATQVANSLNMKFVKILKFKYLDSYGSSVTNGYEPQAGAVQKDERSQPTPIYASESHVRVDIELKVQLE